MGRFGAKKCALLQCIFGRSRLTHSHHLLGKRVRRRYYRFVNRHLVSFVISESTNGVYMDWGRFYPRRCWGLLAVLPYGLCSFPSPHIRPQCGRRFPSSPARIAGVVSPLEICHICQRQMSIPPLQIYHICQRQMSTPHLHLWRWGWPTGRG